MGRVRVQWGGGRGRLVASVHVRTLVGHTSQHTTTATLLETANWKSQVGLLFPCPSVMCKDERSCTVIQWTIISYNYTSRKNTIF